MAVNVLTVMNLQFPWNAENFNFHAGSFYFVGVDIIRKALRMPCMQIAKNAGVDASVVVAKVEELGSEVGYDALNNEYVNMMEKGIIDPTKVWDFC